MNEYAQSISGIRFHESRNEVWHENDKGDVRMAYVDVKVPSRYEATQMRERVRRDVIKSIQKWDAMLEAEDCRRSSEVRFKSGPHSMSHRIEDAALHYVPGPDMGDYRRVYYIALVKREKPELMNIDSLAYISEAQGVDQGAMVADFFNQMDGFSVNNPNASVDVIDNDAVADKSLPERARIEEEETAKLRYKLEHRSTN